MSQDVTKIPFRELLIDLAASLAEVWLCEAAGSVDPWLEYAEFIGRDASVDIEERRQNNLRWITTIINELGKRWRENELPKDITPHETLQLNATVLQITARLALMKETGPSE